MKKHIAGAIISLQFVGAGRAAALPVNQNLGQAHFLVINVHDKTEVTVLDLLAYATKSNWS